MRQSRTKMKRKEHAIGGDGWRDDQDERQKEEEARQMWVDCYSPEVTQVNTTDGTGRQPEESRAGSAQTSADFSLYISFMVISFCVITKSHS